MHSPEIVLSFNEIFFYFTRAAVGVGVPYGLAEDFARSSIWLGVNGFDPAKHTLPALKSLDEGKSSIKIFQTDKINETLFSSLERKKVSALQGGVAICDSIESLSEKSYTKHKFIIKNVDCPLLIAAAIGNYNSTSWKISWKGPISKIISFYLFQNGYFKTCLLDDNSFKNCSPSDVLIERIDNQNINSKKLKNLKTYSKNRKKFLEKGIAIYSDWGSLHSYFSRVLVPSDEKSRVSGAGAGLIDKD